jgi:hypothetical protein
MTLRGSLIRMVTPLLMMGFAPACGGKILGGTVGSGEASGTISATDGGGASCVDFEILPSDVSCGSDSDCSFVPTGEVCSGQSLCGDTAPVNAAAEARFQSETASLNLEACSSTIQIRCLGGLCTLCGDGPNQPICNEDEGITTPSDSGIVIVEGGEFDTGISYVDGGACVDIDLSNYDQSCNQASDCVQIRTGEVCSGQCACGGSPVNVREQSRYDQAIADIMFAGCFCPPEVVPSCFENKCILPVVLPVDP